MPLSSSIFRVLNGAEGRKVRRSEHSELYEKAVPRSQDVLCLPLGLEYLYLSSERVCGPDGGKEYKQTFIMVSDPHKSCQKAKMECRYGRGSSGITGTRYPLLETTESSQNERILFEISHTLA
jgi:hypothetical protein